MQTVTVIAVAAELGADHGRSAGTWVIDGNTTDDACAEILRMDADGDPALYDALPGGPLSGEWADSMTPAILMGMVGASNLPDTAATDMIVDDVCEAYERAWYDAMREQVIAEATARLA